MKKIIYFTLSTIIFISFSCSKEYIQIYDTNTTNTKQIEGLWVFETDTLKVTYEFWASKGVMYFSLFNKLDKPIYIDWKNCSFIYNNNKLNYWIDEQQSTLVSYYGGYFYNGPLIIPGLTINNGVQNSFSTTTKPERITFIPPKSNYYRSQFYLLPIDYFKFNSKTVVKTTVPRNDKPKKMTNVYENLYDINTTPLKFRNFLSISLVENSNDFFYVDNNFFLSSVKEMDYRHFQGKILTDSLGERFYSKPTKKKTSFYKKILTENSMDYK